MGLGPDRLTVEWRRGKYWDVSGLLFREPEWFTLATNQIRAGEGCVGIFPKGHPVSRMWLKQGLVGAEHFCCEQSNATFLHCCQLGTNWLSTTLWILAVFFYEVEVNSKEQERNNVFFKAKISGLRFVLMENGEGCGSFIISRELDILFNKECLFHI